MLDHRLHRLLAERLKLHMENKHTFNPTTLRAESGPCKGDYSAFPGVLGTPELKHPAPDSTTPPSQSSKEGCLPRQLGRGARRQECWRPMIRHPDRRHRHRLSRVRPRVPQEARLVGRAHAQEKSSPRARTGKPTTRAAYPRSDPARCAPMAMPARVAIWNFPDPVPTHREPLFSSVRPGCDYRPTRTAPSYGACPLSSDRCRPGTTPRTSAILTSVGWWSTKAAATRPAPTIGRRNCRGDVHRGKSHDAAQLKSLRAISYGSTRPRVARLKIRAWSRSACRRAWYGRLFNFGGGGGRRQRSKYPEGAARSSSVKPSIPDGHYGYDAVTMMQETKASLCRLSRFSEREPS